MKSFDRIFAAVLAVIALIFAGANFVLINRDNAGTGRPYRVEISRLVGEIEENGIENADPSECEYVTGIVKKSDMDEDFYKAESDCVIREINGELYRFDYRHDGAENSGDVVTVNLFLGAMSAVIVAVMIFVRVKILAPFYKLRDVPYELSKGNLTIPVKENRNRFFGRFVWGVDMLRDNLEQQKQRELQLHKEKKTLLLSLSHDIKTPLSAIKLYSKALSRGLYEDKEKQLEIAESINAKADEIEAYVTQIIRASNEDFLNLEVNNSEFYLSVLMDSIVGYYSEKLSLAHIDFRVGKYGNCLLLGDCDRAVEVLQNVMENAVKYGGEQLEILFSEEEGCQLITVRNNGNTLPKAELHNIFESFWRGSNSDNVNGSGLGLYICRQLMRKMNGEIFAEIKDEFISVTAVFRKA